MSVCVTCEKKMRKTIESRLKKLEKYAQDVEREEERKQKTAAAGAIRRIAVVLGLQVCSEKVGQTNVRSSEPLKYSA